MTSILGKIRTAEADRRREAVEVLKQVLRAYAQSHGGRFWIYGSAARGEMRDHSDVDILIDFPGDDGAAWNFAERACAERGLRPDVNRLAWCRRTFLDHVLTEAVELA